ncbi:radical SAM family heme chaperone HemW [Paracrocinitomix mangrovi]|uniref:radical SAM family heme chaperone HemW n=1 Tax=Paracrocinitomix mangrovi TaxID=2862509 RepID=UPI001C8E5A59|nr:radical SAM family heme chaperone HemW [Paracrocinitomix mangrovi]UKN00377.1 radical SAM family heme chaperone HemW [Paracrocinitomix mangrovi]
MSGIYVHIPYCKVKCHYCDFHFSTNTKGQSEMIDAIVIELEKRKSYLQNETVETIYFGGGTPSILNKEELKRILDTIYSNFEVAANTEITIETNPDDLSEAKLSELKEIGFNRLSIGIQSFDDEVLQMMNRAHSSFQATECVLTAQNLGFDNITVDLIYGIPNQTIEYWEKQLQKLVDLNVPHVSSYCLTIEPNTVFGKRFKNGQITVPEDVETVQQFKKMREVFKKYDYEHYEISNFAKEGYISKHNSAYWLGKKYLGIGPSAHSFDGKNRGWNIANNPQYIKKIIAGENVHTIEELTEKDKFNDYILTRLRTKWGLNLNEVKQLAMFLSLDDFNNTLLHHQNEGHIKIEDGFVYLTEEGMLLADQISADLFV